MALGNTFASFYDILNDGGYQQKPAQGMALQPLRAGFDEEINGVPQGWAEFLIADEAIPDLYYEQNAIWDYIQRGRSCVVYTYENEPAQGPIPVSTFIIHEIEDSIGAAGEALVRISGPSLLDELTWIKLWEPIGSLVVKTTTLTAPVLGPRHVTINQNVTAGQNHVNVSSAADIAAGDEFRTNTNNGALVVTRVTNVDGNKIGLAAKFTDPITQPRAADARSRRVAVASPEYFADGDRVGLYVSGDTPFLVFTVEQIEEPEPDDEDQTRYIWLAGGIPAAAASGATFFKNDYSTPTAADVSTAMSSVLIGAQGGRWALEMQANRTAQTSQNPNGASILATLQQIAKENGETFRLRHVNLDGYPSRVVQWIHTPAFNGIEIVSPTNATIRADERNASKAIVQAVEVRDDNTIYNVAYVTGGKPGEERLTIRECDTATLQWADDRSFTIVQSSDDRIPDRIVALHSIANFGKREVSLDFPDIVPENNSPQARTAAANKMLKQAVNEMYRYNGARRMFNVTCIAKRTIRAGDLIALTHTDGGHFGTRSYQYNTAGNYLYITAASSTVENDVLTYDLTLSNMAWGYWSHEETDASLMAQLVATVNAMRTAMNVDPSGITVIGGGGGAAPVFTAGPGIVIANNTIAVNPPALAGNGLDGDAGQLFVNTGEIRGNALRAEGTNTKLGVDPTALAGQHLTAYNSNSQLAVNVATLGPALAGAGIGYGGGALNVNTAVPLQISGDTLGLKLGANPGLVVDGTGGLSLNTPLELSAMTANSLGASHAHAVVTATDGRLATNANTAHRTILAANYQGALGLAALSAPILKSNSGEGIDLRPGTKSTNLLGNLNLTDGNATVAATAGQLTLQGYDAGTSTPASLSVSGNKEVVFNNWQNGWKVRSSNYVSQATGWAISHGETGGHADFRSLYADEMHVRAFIADLEQALAGGQVITKSVAVLNRPLTLPATANSTVRVYVQDLPGWPGTAVFDRRVNDRVRMVYLDRADGFNYTQVWGEVQRDSFVNEGDGEQSWLVKFTYLGSGALAANKTIGKGALVLDYGREPRAHFYEVNAIDPAGAPWVRAGSHAQFNSNGTPAATSVHFQAGNLASLAGLSDEVGVFAGDSLNTHYAAFSNRRGEMHGIAHTLYDSGGRDGLRIRLHALTLDTQVNPTGAVTSKMPSADVATNNLRKSSGASAAYTYVANNPSTGQPDATHVANNLPQYAALKMGFAAYPTTTKIAVLKAFVAHEGTSTGDDVTLYAQLFNGGTAISDEVVVDRFAIPYNTTGGSFVTIPFSNISGTTDWAAIQILFSWRYEALNRTATIKLDPAVPSIAVGNPLPLGTVSGGPGLWVGAEEGVYKLRIGDPAGSNLLYDGAALTLRNGTDGAQIQLDAAQPHIAMGAVLPTGAQTGGSGFWAGLEGTQYTWRVGGISGVAPRIEWYDNSLTIRAKSGASVIHFDSQGESYFAGPMTIGPNGGIWQGVAGSSFTTPKSGWKLWRDAAGAGRFETYDVAGEAQVTIDSSGKLTAGQGGIRLDRNGVSFWNKTLNAESAKWDSQFGQLVFKATTSESLYNLIRWNSEITGLPASYITTSDNGSTTELRMASGPTTGRHSFTSMSATAPAGKAAWINIQAAVSSGSTALFQLYAEHPRTLNKPTIVSNTNLYADGAGLAAGYLGPLNQGQIVSDIGGVHDYEAIILMDTVDVNHGMTAAIANTAAYGALIKYNPTAGGIDLRGFGEGYVGTAITGYATTATAGLHTAPVVVNSLLKTPGAATAGTVASGNLVTFNNAGASRVIFKHNGDIYSDSTAGVLLFDDRDDAALLRALSYELNPAAVIRNQFDAFVTYNRADLEAAGIVDGTMVNLTALTRLLTGAIWQLHSRIAELEAQLGRTG